MNKFFKQHPKIDALEQGSMGYLGLYEWTDVSVSHHKLLSWHKNAFKSLIHSFHSSERINAYYNELWAKYDGRSEKDFFTQMPQVLSLAEQT